MRGRYAGVNTGIRRPATKIARNRRETRWRLGLWILERCAHERFPYRLQVLKGEEPWLTLRVQDRWPTANRNIFCLREKEPPELGEVLEEMERVPVVALQRRGRRLSIVLNRKRYSASGAPPVPAGRGVGHHESSAPCG